MKNREEKEYSLLPTRAAVAVSRSNEMGRICKIWTETVRGYGMNRTIVSRRPSAEGERGANDSSCFTLSHVKSERCEAFSSSV